MTPLRIGTLGAARITPPALLAPASKRDDVEVVAVAARDRTRAQSFADKRDIPRVLDVADRPGPQLVDDRLRERVVAPVERLHHDDIGVRGGDRGDATSLVGVCRERFLAQHVLARFDRRDRPLGVV